MLIRVSIRSQRPLHGSRNSCHQLILYRRCPKEWRSDEEILARLPQTQLSGRRKNSGSGAATGKAKADHSRGPSRGGTRVRRLHQAVDAEPLERRSTGKNQAVSRRCFGRASARSRISLERFAATLNSSAVIVSAAESMSSPTLSKSFSSADFVPAVLFVEMPDPVLVTALPLKI